jgi:hypothetical protein
MQTYAFATPILPGKTKAWLDYISEATGPKREQFKATLKRLGVRSEQAWIQNMPTGDLGIVKIEVDDPIKFFQEFMKSEVAFDKWFREKVLVECLGMPTSQPVGKFSPPLNRQVMDISPIELEPHKETRSKVSTT